MGPYRGGLSPFEEKVLCLEIVWDRFEEMGVPLGVRRRGVCGIDVLERGGFYKIGRSIVYAAVVLQGCRFLIDFAEDSVPIFLAVDIFNTLVEGGFDLAIKG